MQPVLWLSLHVLSWFEWSHLLHPWCWVLSDLCSVPPIKAFVGDVTTPPWSPGLDLSPSVHHQRKVQNAITSRKHPKEAPLWYRRGQLCCREKLRITVYAAIKNELSSFLLKMLMCTLCFQRKHWSTFPKPLQNSNNLFLHERNAISTPLKKIERTQNGKSSLTFFRAMFVSWPICHLSRQDENWTDLRKAKLENITVWAKSQLPSVRKTRYVMAVLVNGQVICSSWCAEEDTHTLRWLPRKDVCVRHHPTVERKLCTKDSAKSLLLGNKLEMKESEL